MKIKKKLKLMMAAINSIVDTVGELKEDSAAIRRYFEETQVYESSHKPNPIDCDYLVEKGVLEPAVNTVVSQGFGAVAYNPIADEEEYKPVSYNDIMVALTSLDSFNGDNESIVHLGDAQRVLNWLLEVGPYHSSSPMFLKDFVVSGHQGENTHHAHLMCSYIDAHASAYVKGCISARVIKSLFLDVDYVQPYSMRDEDISIEGKHAATVHRAWPDYLVFELIEQDEKMCRKLIYGHHLVEEAIERGVETLKYVDVHSSVLALGF